MNKINAVLPKKPKFVMKDQAQTFFLEIAERLERFQ